MEKRGSRRIKKRAILKVDNISSILLDFSRKGIKFSTTKVPLKKGVDILFDVGIEKFEIKAIICWVKQKVALSKSYDIGAIIKEAPEGYYQFVDNLRD